MMGGDSAYKKGEQEMFEKCGLFAGITEVAVAICVYSTYDKNRGIRVEDINYVVTYDIEDRQLKMESIQYIDMVQHCYIAEDLDRYPVVLDGEVITEERKTLIPGLYSGYSLVGYDGIEDEVNKAGLKKAASRSTNAEASLKGIALVPEMHSFKARMEKEIHGSCSMR